MPVQLFKSDDAGAFTINGGEFPNLDAAKAEAERRIAMGESGFLVADTEVHGEGDEAFSKALWCDPATEAVFAAADAAGECPCGELLPAEVDCGDPAADLA